jgi:hypothetical protein
MAAPVLQFKRGLLANLPGLRAGEPGFTTDSYDLYVGLTSEVSTNKFFGSHRYWKKETTTAGSGVNLVEGTSNGGSYVTLKSPDSLAGITTYTLPASPINGYVLTTDTNGVLSWTTSLNELAITNLVSGIGTFTNNVAFTTTTDNTLGNPNTGAVQIDGGVGIEKNLTVGAGLSVSGESHFIGTATFYGGQINLGDSDGDNISVAGEFVSNLVPNATNTYDLGLTGKRWRDGYFSRNLDVTGNLNVGGNVTIGGTTVTLLGQDVYIQNKDIILGYTTSITGTDISTDDTANHAGVAIASTIGTPLVPFTASGINTLPDTYKQMMWFHEGTLGFGTDAFAFNYGVAIGTTAMANGVRLAVGSGVTVSDTSVSATTFYGSFVGNVSSADQLKTVTASDNNANYYVTFVDANNGSATNETVYTDDGIYYNPGTNTFTTQHVSLTGNLNVAGITTLAGNVNLGDSGSDTLVVSGVATFNQSVKVNGTLTVGSVTIGSTTGGSSVGEDISTRNITASGIITATGLIDGNGGASISGYIELDNVNVSGATTVTSLNATGNVTLGDNSSDTITVKGTTTFEQPVVGTIGTATRSTLVDTTGTSSNADYYVTFVDTLAGQTNETLRVGAGLSVNPSNGSVKTAGTLSVGNESALTSYIKSGGGSNAMYLYANGDVSFQSKIIASQIRSNDNSNALITLSGLNATFAQDIAVTGITTTGTLKLSGTSGIGITGISASTTLTENSDNYLPTQKAVKAYVDTVDLTIGTAGDTGTGTVSTSQTFTIAGTANEIETSASGQTITVGLPDAVVVGTSLSAPTLRTGTIQSSNTGSTAITIVGNDVTITDDLTVSGNLYVNGNTTQVNTASLTVEDRTIQLGIVDGASPTTATTWDLGVLFNYYTDSVKQSAVVWEHADARFKFGSVISDGGGTGNNNPQITVSTFAPIEIGSLWVTDCAGTSQVISCTGSTRNLENITIDAGTF